MIYVYADWKGLDGPLMIGVLHQTKARTKYVYSFDYNKDWLSSEFTMLLDPELALYAGQQYVGEGKQNFGIFLDSAPDKWGRKILDRYEVAQAVKENRSPRILTELDYLLRVYDRSRMGGLRFKEDPDGEFLNAERKLAAPPWASLRDLQFASLKYEEETLSSDPDYAESLALLLGPGSSLGGARPKASVTDSEGNLWIAKFPSGSDFIDVGAWEMIVHRMALDAGIDMTESQAERFGDHQYHTFLTKRFDRENEERIHYASAMTLLAAKDFEGGSYLEIIEFITQHGANVDEDLEQLFCRMAFNVTVKNTDDHLRNHGFLLTTSGWQLSPAFDINPNPRGFGLNLNIDENSNALDLDLVLRVCEYFRLDRDQAYNHLERICASVSRFEQLAVDIDLPKAEVDLLRTCFITELTTSN